MFIIMCHVVGVGGETVIEPFMRPRGMFRGAGWLLKSDSRKQLVCGIRVLCYHLLLLSNLCGGVYRNHYRFIIRHRNKHWAIYKFVSIYIHHIYNQDYHHHIQSRKSSDENLERTSVRHVAKDCGRRSRREKIARILAELGREWGGTTLDWTSARWWRFLVAVDQFLLQGGLVAELLEPKLVLAFPFRSGIGRKYGECRFYDWNLIFFICVVSGV